MSARILVQLGIAVLIGMGLMFRSASLRQLLDNLIEDLNNRRGGPPPTHPLPGNDGVVVLRRRRKPQL